MSLERKENLDVELYNIVPCNGSESSNGHEDCSIKFNRFCGSAIIRSHRCGDAGRMVYIDAIDGGDAIACRRGSSGSESRSDEGSLKVCAWDIVRYEISKNDADDSVLRLSGTTRPRNQKYQVKHVREVLRVRLFR